MNDIRKEKANSLHEIIKSNRFKSVTEKNLNELFTLIIEPNIFFEYKVRRDTGSEKMASTSWLLSKSLVLFGEKINSENKLQLIKLLLHEGKNENLTGFCERFYLIPQVIFSNYIFYRKNFNYSWALIVNGLNGSFNKRFDSIGFQYGIHLNKNFKKIYKDEKFYLFSVAMNNSTTKNSALKIFSKHFRQFNKEIRSEILESLIMDLSIPVEYFIGFKGKTSSFDYFTLNKMEDRLKKKLI